MSLNKYKNLKINPKNIVFTPRELINKLKKTLKSEKKRILVFDEFQPKINAELSQKKMQKQQDEFNKFYKKYRGWFIENEKNETNRN